MDKGIGSILRLCWVWMKGIPLHAWSETTFRLLVDCVGQVVKIDEDALLRRRMDVLQVQVLRNLHACALRSIALGVDGVRISIAVSVEETVESRNLLLEFHPSGFAQSRNVGEGAGLASFVQPETCCLVSLQLVGHFSLVMQAETRCLEFAPSEKEMTGVAINSPQFQGVDLGSRFHLRSHGDISANFLRDEFDVANLEASLQKVCRKDRHLARMLVDSPPGTLKESMFLKEASSCPTVK